MAHSHHAHREHVVAKKRVHHILKGHKRGGAAHPDEAQDRKLFKKMLKEHDAKVHGKKSGGRLDKYARGGKTKGKHGNHVNIAIVAPHGAGQQGAAPAAPGVLPPPGGGLPPKPPMMPPPGAGGPPGGLPPGMMKRGGKVPMKAGAITGEGRKEKKKAYGLKPLPKH